MMDNIFLEFPGCDCLKLILINSGYDNLSSLKCINQERLNELEKHIDKNRENFEASLEVLTCDHKNRYLEQKTFQFLPGHSAVMLDWRQNEIQNRVQDEVQNKTKTVNKEHPAFTRILKEIIASALTNHTKTANLHRFSEILMDFSIYLFITAGRSCYETLSANLPLPQAGTICKLEFIFVHIYYSY